MAPLLQARFIGDEAVYKNFLEILNLYRKGSKSIAQVYTEVSFWPCNTASHYAQSGQPHILELCRCESLLSFLMLSQYVGFCHGSYKVEIVRDSVVVAVETCGIPSRKSGVCGPYIMRLARLSQVFAIKQVLYFCPKAALLSICLVVLYCRRSLASSISNHPPSFAFVCCFVWL